MNNRVEFFNLVDGQSAIIRILSTSVDKISKAFVHSIEVNGSKKSIRCLRTDCPLCDDNEPFERLYVHLWDYTDNKEKVWSRTTNKKFMKLLLDIEENWGNLSECVIKITREGTNFPNYSIVVLNPTKYPFPNSLDEKCIDEDIAYRYSLYRSREELEEFMRTGFLPEHVKKQSSQQYISKSEWIKQQNEKKQQENLNNVMRSYEESHLNKEEDKDDDFDDPFIRRTRNSRG